MAGLFLLLPTLFWCAQPAFAATPYYSYYDPLYDAVAVETPATKPVSLGDSLFGKTGEGETGQGGVGGFLSGFQLQVHALTTTDYTDNARLSEHNRESDLAQTVAAGIAAESGWERHALRFGMNGHIKRYRETVSENEDAFNMFTDGRIDLADDWSLNANLYYISAPERRGASQEVNANLPHLRETQTAGGNLGFAYSGYPFTFSMRGGYEHITVERLENEAQGYRDRDVMRYVARLSYPLNDDVYLFIQPTYAEETYDVARDASGINRDSRVYELLGGIAYQVTDITALNLGVGQIRREFDDARLEDTQGLSVDASLRWSPYEEFSLDARLIRTIESTTLSGVNDLEITSLRLVPAYRLTPEMMVDGELGLDHIRFSHSARKDDDYLAGLGLHYLWGERFQTGIRYRYRQRASNAIDRDFYSNTILLTLSCSL